MWVVEEDVFECVMVVTDVLDEIVDEVMMLVLKESLAQCQ